MKKSLLFLGAAITLGSSTSLALSLTEIIGLKRTVYQSPQGISELCATPRKWAGATYTDSDSKKEDTLCKYDFYATVGICPKYSSTNPGLMIIEPDARFSKQAIDASDCDLKKLGLKTDAKFKQSITCSYTPSILGYYHLSRILGDVGRVPVSVFRSIDIKTHKAQTTKAMNYLRNTKLAIKDSWAMLERVHANPQNYPNLVERSGTQMFGALSDNIRNEEQYVEVSGVGSYDSRYERFLKQRPYQLVSNSASPQQIIGSNEFTRVAQTVLQMKDVSDMVIIDTLMNQQDRIGNIHYKFVWYTIHPQSLSLERFKSKAKIKNGKITIPAEEQASMANRKAVLLKEMILKDNDCGVIKTNMMRRVSAIEGVKHVSYRTYANLLSFETALSGPSAKEFFTKELLFSDSDYNTLKRNALFARQILVKKCQSGELKFDVDLEDYIPGATPIRKACGS